MTRKEYDMDAVWSISIHTPAWGVTKQHAQTCRIINYFNPHARVGRDIPIREVDSKDFWISIHTPAWGVTADDTPDHATISISIHTPAWGVTAC